MKHLRGMVHVCMYTCLQVYQPTKFLPAGARDLRVSA